MIFRGPRGPPQDERTLTLSVLDFLNSDVLKGEHILVERDIERCHFVGKPRTSRSQQILVKFARYHDKWKVYSSKKNLKNHPNKTFLTEDLTKMNHAVVKSLLPLKKAEKIWTRDGRIIVEKDSNEDPVRISPADNINLKLLVLMTLIPRPSPEMMTTSRRTVLLSGCFDFYNTCSCLPTIVKFPVSINRT